MTNQIVASILDCDFRRLAAEVEAVDAHVDRYQVDVMDGHFVPNLSFGFPILEAMRKLTKRPLEADLMISNPDRYAARYAKAGADYVIIHVEASDRPAQHVPGDPRSRRQARHQHQPRHVRRCDPRFSARGRHGAGDDGASGLRRPVVHDRAAGAGESHPASGATNWASDLHIEVDGGVKPDTAKLAVDAGADLLVTGSYIYGSDDYQKAIATFRSHIA